MQYASVLERSDYMQQVTSLPTRLPAGAVITDDLQDHMLLTHTSTTAYIRVAMGTNIQMPRVLQDAMELMENNLEEPLSICELADLLGLSRRHLERQFAACLDSSPSKVYMDIRLRYAHYLINDTSFKICQIARICGFNSSTSFSCLFKQKFAISPSKVRKVQMAA